MKNLYAEFGGVQKTTARSTKKMSARDLFEETLATQYQYAQGKQKPVKGKPPRSWFSDPPGVFRPYVGRFSLLGPSGKVAYREGQEKKLLDKTKAHFESGDFDELLKTIEGKMKK